MRRLLLPFFWLKLALVITPGLVRFGLPQLPPLAPISFSLGLFLLVMWGQPPFSTHPIETSSDLTVLGAKTNLTGIVSSDRTQIELDRWLNLYHTQPTHRDVLLNIALLYQARGQIEEAQKFHALAKAVDPNNPLVDQLLPLEKP